MRASGAGGASRAVEASPAQIAALGQESLSVFRAALTHGDLDGAYALLASLAAHHPVAVATLRKRLAEFDIEGVLACTGASS